MSDEKEYPEVIGLDLRVDAEALTEDSWWMLKSVLDTARYALAHRAQEAIADRPGWTVGERYDLRFSVETAIFPPEDSVTEDKERDVP